jgi:hypothetical protein
MVWSGALIQIRHKSLKPRNVFGNDSILEGGELRQNFHDLCIAEMLKNLPYQHNISVWKVIFGSIENKEINSGIATSVLFDNEIYDIACGERANAIDELATDMEVATSDVDNRWTPDFNKKRSHRFHVGVNDGLASAATARVRTELQSAAPNFLSIDFCEDFRIWLVGEPRLVALRVKGRKDTR